MCSRLHTYTLCRWITNRLNYCLWMYHKCILRILNNLTWRRKVTSAPGSMCSRFFRKKIENWKLVKKFRKNHARTRACHAPSCQIWRRIDIVCALCKNDKSQIWKFKILDLFYVRILSFLHRAAAMSFHRQIWHDGAWHAQVRAWFFFGIFRHVLNFQKKFKKKRVHVHPGAHVSFR